MLENIADFTAWPMMGKGYLTNFGRFGTHHRLLRCWCGYRVMALKETILIEHEKSK